MRLSEGAAVTSQKESKKIQEVNFRSPFGLWLEWIWAMARGGGFRTIDGSLSKEVTARI